MPTAKALDDAAQACTILQRNGFGIPGVWAALTQAATVAQSAAAADPRWEPLSTDIDKTKSDYDVSTTDASVNSDAKNHDYEVLTTDCAEAGVPLFVD
jgi:hypothetical protein